VALAEEAAPVAAAAAGVEGRERRVPVVAVWARWPRLQAVAEAWRSGSPGAGRREAEAPPSWAAAEVEEGVWAVEACCLR